MFHLVALRCILLREECFRMWQIGSFICSSTSGGVWSLPLESLFRVACRSRPHYCVYRDPARHNKHQVLNTQYSKLSHPMKGKERWSLLDGQLLRRRRSAQAAIDQLLDRLVDIFDFPLAPPSYNGGSLPVAHPTSRKYSTSTADTYTTMDGSISPRSRSRECTIGGGLNRPRKVSMADRVRELLLRSSRSGSSKTRNSVAKCSSAAMKNNNASDANELRMSWLPKNKTTPKEPQDELWIERDEQDRQLECGYQCLADEATI